MSRYWNRLFRYLKIHFDARRNTHETSTSEEFMIAVNGPNLAKSDAVVKEAMTSCWRSKRNEWHFYRKGRSDKLTEFDSGSQVIDRLIKKTKQSLKYYL